MKFVGGPNGESLENCSSEILVGHYADLSLPAEALVPKRLAVERGRPLSRVQDSWEGCEVVTERPTSLANGIFSDRNVVSFDWNAPRGS